MHQELWLRLHTPAVSAGYLATDNTAAVTQYNRPKCDKHGDWFGPSTLTKDFTSSYLGVGVSAPLPSLGSMATDALSGMYTYTYRLIVPSVILSIMILAFNLFEGLRDALDPKLKK